MFDDTIRIRQTLKRKKVFFRASWASSPNILLQEIHFLLACPNNPKFKKHTSICQLMHIQTRLCLIRRRLCTVCAQILVGNCDLCFDVNNPIMQFSGQTHLYSQAGSPLLSSMLDISLKG